MVAYYISYGDEPPRRFPWRILLAILAALLLIGIVIAVWWRWPSDGEGSPAANRPDAVPFAAAVPAVFAPNTNTLYVVDVSGSIAEGGHLEAVKLALSTLALEDAAVGSGAMAENSRASLMTFGGDAEPETIVARAALRKRAAQEQWLIRVNALAAVATGSLIYDAVNSAYQGVLSTDSDGRENAIVVLSDGIDGMVGECRPARADETTEYCIGDSGDPVLCANLPEARRSSGPGRICEAVPSKTDPYALLGQLARSAEQDGLKVHTIGYGSPDTHQWLELAAAATDGQYIYAGR